jgi:PAS domain S-box-containing protein
MGFMSASIAAATDRELDAQLDTLRAEFAALQCELQQERTRLHAALDVNEQLRLDLGLRNAALEAATSYFMVVDAVAPGAKLVYVNRAAAADHGYTPEELVGRSVKLLMTRRSTEDERSEFRRKLNTGETTRAEMEVVRRDGSMFWAGFYSAPLRDARGVVTHFVIVGADITVRRESERKKEELQQQLYNEMRERERMAIELRLAQKLESVGRLAAGLAHEINTPIQYVGDSVYFLRSAFEDLFKLFNAYRETVGQFVPANDAALTTLAGLEKDVDLSFLEVEVPKAIERTLEGANRVAGIVRAMKEFAHPDTVEHTPADLNHALQTTLVVAHNEYKYAALIQTQYGELLPVTCNVGELNQVFLNLIVNAAHAIQDSGKDVSTGRIQVTTAILGEVVQVTIGDNGCGIPAENIEKIFDPFYTTKEVGRGTGQGLSIARSIVVDKHGGNIDVHSEAGVGTRFVISLPVNGRSGTRAG